MNPTALHAISPLDGRYSGNFNHLGQTVSEWGLMKFRVLVEVEWLRAMSDSPDFPEVRALAAEEKDILQKLAAGFDDTAASRIKEIEKTTNHDVKAVEYYLREQLSATPLRDVCEWLHFGCTSEDINNLAHALMCKGAVVGEWLPLAEDVVSSVAALAREHASVPMLARTHGQPASPTTVGKELAVFVSRWRRQLEQVRAREYLGKFNGAVGNFNAHTIAYPNAPWNDISNNFVTSLGLQHNPTTTQIEPHDYLAEIFHAIIRFNNILLDFVRDVWSYISIGYLKQRVVAGEVGSSTMPHKVNPINFENAEANLGLGNATLDHLANKLPISRLQRDLTDSSAIRNMGVGIAHSCLALTSTLQGLKKLSVHQEALAKDLDDAWEVLGEAVQTVMRKNGDANAYEKLKELTRGAGITREALQQFVSGLELPENDRQRLLQLTPATYIGIAEPLARGAVM